MCIRDSDKGIVNNKLSNALMQKLEKEGIPTHYVEELNDRDTLVKKVQIVPLEVIIRNVAAGHFSLRMGVPSKRTLIQLWTHHRPDVVHIATEGPLGASALSGCRNDSG